MTPRQIGAEVTLEETMGTRLRTFIKKTALAGNLPIRQVGGGKGGEKTREQGGGRRRQES